MNERQAKDGGPRRHTDPSLREQQVPDVEPDLDPTNLTATRVPAERKPVAGAEYNPGSGEYGERTPPRPAGTDAAAGKPSSAAGPTDASDRPTPPEH
jgi:hypothetical protein